MPWYYRIGALLLTYLLPTELLKNIVATRQSADETACILFSSGSEGTPKGICLSHKNIQANVQQTLHVMNPDESDIIMGNLPLFHAFGMTVTQFLPLICGIPVVFNADPTDVVGSAKLIARYQASIMFGTSTFFRLYVKNKRVQPLMLQSLRLIVSGAEKLNKQIQQAFLEKFQLPIYEGYGATEASPVVSVNMPDQLSISDMKVQLGNRAGSVGMPLPGTSIGIVDPNTFEDLPNSEAGMILIAGVQIMQGYLNDTEKTNQVIVEKDGQRWYVTGDKGQLDEDGFLVILDRYSRFAKVGGEMISLGLVEQVINELYAQHHPDQDEDNLLEVSLVAVEDDKRGEKLILLSNHSVDELVNADSFSQKGLSNLALPAKTFQVENIPKLASGKVDFPAVKKLALSML
jgi:acyl-[acyl-carrier-protein]-phospholipid O-acyltransferase/long-chain-fatty-acid--[acyl-carrier-protein] ligase